MKQILLITIFAVFGFITAHAAVGDKIEGETSFESEGARNESANLGYIKNGTWAKYNVSFSGEEEWIDIAASGNPGQAAGGTIEIRLGDSNGTVIGTTTVTPTSGWNDYQLFRADITETTGDVTLCLVFVNADAGDGYLFNIDYFKLMATVPNYSVSSTVSPANAGFVATDVKTAEVSQGTDVIFYAQRSEGYSFNHWEDATGTSLSTDNPATFKINAVFAVTAVFDQIQETNELPNWTFDNEYAVDSTGDINIYTPVMLPISYRPGFKDSKVYPDNYPATATSVMTSKGDTIFTSLTGDYQVCRINWTDANEITDFTDASQHNQYYEFQISTIGFQNISVDFTFSGGQSDVNDYLELVYSVDNGSTWVDGGSTYSADHWNSWVNGNTTLSGADNTNVIVRLIGISANTGSNLNFNLDYFTVTGDEFVGINKKTLQSAIITSDMGCINVSVEAPTNVMVYSLTGKLIANENVNSSISIPCQSGMFIVKAGNYVQKVCVTR